MERLVHSSVGQREQLFLGDAHVLEKVIHSTEKNRKARSGRHVLSFWFADISWSAMDAKSSTRVS